ncbi:MAG: c-type cytochrome, partial [Myxococcota bacterium]
GPAYHDKPYVHPTNLLTDTRSAEELAAWFSEGDVAVPAYGAVLNPEQLQSIAEFVVGVRSGDLPGPAQVIALSKDAPKNYSLLEGADVERGNALYAEHCATCHGDDGRKLPVDGDQSLGLFMRRKAYEGWFKLVSGHPGSPMKRELPFRSGAEGGQMILDVTAAMCDRTAYPSLDGVPDVPDGDGRCGGYLK